MNARSDWLATAAPDAEAPAGADMLIIASRETGLDPWASAGNARFVANALDWLNR